MTEPLSDRLRFAERQKVDRAAAIRREIVDAAAVEFAERGYHETSIADIGKRLGSAPSMVYNYFSNKRQILEQVMVERLALLANRLAEAYQEPMSTAEDFGAMAVRVGNVIAEVVIADPQIARVLLAGLVSGDQDLREQWVAMFVLVKDKMVEFLQRGASGGFLRADIDAESTARAIIAIPFGIVVTDPTYSAESEQSKDLVAAVATMVTGGIFAEAARPR